jgi:EAL domain-containing protein (putative c-di-GMP-specific phosphodiesterase class I)
MAQADPGNIQYDDALKAAGVCVWDWSSKENRLRFRARGGEACNEFEGDWRLEDFLGTLEGLSAQNLSQRLKDGGAGQRLDLSLKRAEGSRVHVLGAFSETGHARGLLFNAGAGTTINDLPVEAVYQPIIRLSDGMIAGFEALARWRTDTGELKTAGAIEGEAQRMASRHLAVAMLKQAGEALADWHQRFPELNLFVQVNLTSADLYRAEVLESVSRLVQSGAFPLGALKIELTEQMALRDFDAGVAAASALQASGVGLVLDDFGSGHSSLAWLAAIPATGIKLDPQLTQMAGTPRMDTILSSIAGLAKTLGMTVTAEGIEDLDRVQFLKGIGCDYVQGFAYARPMEKEKADRFLDSQNGLEGLT